MEILLKLSFQGRKYGYEKMDNFSFNRFIDIDFFCIISKLIWGFNLPKKDLKDVIVQTEKHSYLVKDKNMVLKIAEDVSKMEKYPKFESLPPQTKPEKYKKLLIRTADNTIYGGSIWVTENNALFNSNGYYWGFDYKGFSNRLNALIKDTTLFHSYEN